MQTLCVSAGARVELVGLSRNDLNGQLATVAGPLNSRGRWPVAMDEGKILAVRPTNLHVIVSGGGAVSRVAGGPRTAKEHCYSVF